MAYELGRSWQKVTCISRRAGVVLLNMLRVLPPAVAAAQIRGVFNGAALVFFSFIGFDAVACSAEEVGGR